MNIGTAFFGNGTAAPAGSPPANRISAFEGALFAYKFFIRQFRPAVRSVLLPISAAGLVLYLSLSTYLAELLTFLEFPNARVASLALGTLAAGLFLSLFCYAIAVTAIANLALGRRRHGSWLRLRAQRQEWRVYAAYLRFLLLLGLVFAAAYLLSAYVTPFLAIPERFAPLPPTLVSIVGVYWLFARIGFLIPAVVAAGEGTVLRKARQESARDLWRNCSLIALLLVPGLLVQIAGEYALRMGAGVPHAAGNLPLADYARSTGEMLGGYLAVASISAFVSIVLLTAGAIGVYRGERFESMPEAGKQRSGFHANPRRSVPGERLPE